jgi:hypothetical protein
MGSATVQGQRWGTGPGYWAEVIESEHELAGVAGVVPEPQPGTGTLDRDGGEPGGAEDAAHAVESSPPSACSHGCRPAAQLTPGL